MHLCPQIRMNVQRKLMLAQLSHHVSILLVHTAVIVRLVGEIEVHTPASMLTSAWWDLTVVHQIHGVLILHIPTAASVWQVGETKDPALVLILTSVLLDHHHHNRLLPLPLQIWFHSTLLEMYNGKPFVFLLRQRLLCEYHWL